MLDLASADGVTLTPLQLIKLVYLCHGWTVGVRSVPLLKEPIEAWRYGPVVRSLYRALREYGGQAILARLPQRTDENLEPFDDMIQTVFKSYGKATGIQLSALTHQPGTPWAITYRNGEGENSVISFDLIEQHYREKLRSDAA